MALGNWRHEWGRGWRERNGTVKLTIIGCAGSFPGPDSPCSAYVVEAEGFRLLIDFGSGSLGALQRHIDPHSIDAIMLTHLHADHVLDACTYVVMRRYAPGAPFPRIPIYGPRDTEARLMEAYGGAGEEHIAPSLRDVYAFHPMAPSTFDLGPFGVTVDLVSHPVETYGVRITHNGRSLAYSSDSGPCDALVRLAQHSDLFLCEASYLEGRDNPPNVHLTGKEAGEHATKAGVGKLVLTHLVTAWGSEERTYEEAASAFNGPIDLARSGAVYQI